MSPQRFVAVNPSTVFVVLKTKKLVDVTPFDTYENAKFAVLRYVKNNRVRWDFPEEFSNETAWSWWPIFTDEQLLIFDSPTWTIESY